MAEQRKKKTQFRLVFRRSNTLTTIVVVAAVTMCLLALLALKIGTAETRSRAAELRAEAAMLEDQQDRLELYIRELGTVQGIILIAQEKLGLVDPDTIVLTPEN